MVTCIASIEANVRSSRDKYINRNLRWLILSEIGHQRSDYNAYTTHFLGETTGIPFSCPFHKCKTCVLLSHSAIVSLRNKRLLLSKVSRTIISPFYYILWSIICIIFIIINIILLLKVNLNQPFVNCLYVARFTIVQSKSQIKFSLLTIYLTNFVLYLQ